MPIVRRTRADLDLSKVDWHRLAATTDREIAKQIAADPDTAPIFSARELNRAKRVVPTPTAEDVRAICRRLGLTSGRVCSSVRILVGDNSQLRARPSPTRGAGARPSQGDRLRAGRGDARFTAIARHEQDDYFQQNGQTP